MAVEPTWEDIMAKNEERRIVIDNPKLRVVTANTFIRSGELARLSVKGRKLFYLAIAQTKIDDEKFYVYEISNNEFAEKMGIDPSGCRRDGYAICADVMRTLMPVLLPNGKYEMFPIFKKCSYTGKGFRFIISDEMSSYMLALKGDFSQPLLDDFMQMRKNSSMGIWHLMQCYMKSEKPDSDRAIKFEISLDELKTVTGTTGKKAYDRIENFKARILIPALDEIEQCCEVSIDLENIKRGHTITGYSFTVSSDQPAETAKKEDTNDKNVSDEEVFAKTLRLFNELSAKDCRKITEAAGYDMAKIEKAYAVLVGTKRPVDNVTGFVIAAIRKEFEVPVKRAAAARRTGFSNFNERTYDFDELEKALLNTEPK